MELINADRTQLVLKIVLQKKEPEFEELNKLMFYFLLFEISHWIQWPIGNQKVRLMISNKNGRYKKVLRQHRKR